MNPDPDDSTLFISDRIEHTKMPNDDINESGSGKIVEVVNIELKIMRLKLNIYSLKLQNN